MSIDLSNLIAYIIYALTITALVVALIWLAFKYSKLMNSGLQLAIDKVVLTQKVQELLSKEDTKNIEQTDGFLKFVSDSRDWAFDYIENVQEAIQDLKAAVDSGDDYEDAYFKLISFLPEPLEPRSEEEVF